jgi:hypothetical protein
MAELGNRLDLALEPADKRRLARCVAGEHLECDHPVHSLVARFEDGPHAPRTKSIEQQVLADPQVARPVAEQRFRLEQREAARVHEVPGHRFGRR